VLTHFLRDVDYAWRQLRRRRSYALVVAAMLTVGVGLSTTTYTAVNGLFLRQWDVRDADAVFLAGLQRTVRPSAGDADDGFTLAAYQYVSAHATRAGYLAYLTEHFDLRFDQAGPKQRIAGMYVSGNFLDVLGIPVQLGTALRPSANGTPAVVISHRLWSRLFAGDPSVVGRMVRIDNATVTIVGVMGAGFDGLGAHTLDILVNIEEARQPPLQESSPAAVRHADTCCIAVAGRAHANVSLPVAREELQLLATQFRRGHGLPDAAAVLTTTAVGPQLMRGEPAMVAGLAFISIAAVLVLVLTWANVGNLFLARSLGRKHEIAVRVSLGASRGHLVRQLMTEGLVLASVAGIVSLAGTVLVPALLRLLEEEADARLFATDWRVAAFTSLAVVSTCLAVSLAPALQATRMPGRGARAGGVLRGVILAVQVAVAVVLTIGATLLTRATIHAATIPADYARDTTSVAFIETPAGTVTSARRQAIRESLFRQARGSDVLIGVADVLPVEVLGLGRSDVREPNRDVHFTAQVLPLSAGGARVLELSLASGRWASDTAGTAEAVVNRTLAEQMWPGENPLGRQVTVELTGGIYTIVGVVRDAHLTAFDRIDPVVHLSPAATGGILPVLVGRADPQFASQVTTLAASVDPSLIVTVMPLRQPLERSLREARIGASLAGGLALVAIVLAVVGVFSVFSYIVEDRRREVGVRIALGGSRAHVRAALFRAIRVPLAAGLIVGLAAACAAGMVLRGFLFGVSPIDLLSYGVALAVIGVAGILAVALPVRRALAIDPWLALRAE